MKLPIGINQIVSTLILNHDLESCSYLQEQLKTLNFVSEITILSSREDYESIVTFKHFDVIILDFDQEGMDALRMLHHLKRLCPDSAILLHVSKVNQNLIEEALESGAQDYLVKNNFDKHHLAASMRYCILALKRAKKVRETTSWNKILFENNPIPLLIVDLDAHLIISMNHAAEKQYCFNNKSILHLNIHELDADADSETLQENYTIILEGSDRSFVRKHRRSNGTYFYADLRSSIIFKDDKHYCLLASVDVSERFYAELNYKDDEARIRSMMDHSSQGYCLLDLDGHVVTKNKVIEQIWSKIIENPILEGDVFVNAFEGIRKEALTASLLYASQGKEISYDTHWKTLDGKDIWFEIGYNPIINSDNIVIGVCHTLKDVTENVKNIHMLEAERANLNSVLQSSTSGCCFVDNNGKIILFNTRFEDLWYLGHHNHLVRNVPLENFVIDELKLYYLQNLSKVLNGEHIVVEREFITPVGESMWTEIIYYPVKIEEGQITGACILVTDITDRKNYQLNLKKSEANLRTTLDNSGQGYCLMDKEGRVLIKNKLIEDLWNLMDFGVICDGDKILDVINPMFKDEFFQKLHRCLNGETVSVKRSMQSTKNTYLSLECIFNPVITDGNIVGICISIRDITESIENENKLIRYAEELSKSNANLSESNEALKKKNSEMDRFIYSASHELRAPLTSILGLLEVSRFETENTQLLEYFDMINTTINKLDATLKNMTSIARNVHSQINNQPIELENLFKNTIHSMKHFSGDIDISYDFNLQDSFYNDKDRLKIILENLLSNAIKYADKNKPQKYIILKVNASREGLEFTIEDNGIGIDNIYHSKVFDMFFRASNAAPGDGLGLYVVKEILDNLKGTIQLNSKLGKGSIFKVFLPNKVVSNQVIAA